MTFLLLLMLLAGRLAAGVQVGQTLVPDNIFYRQLSPDHVAVFAPGVQFAGLPLRNGTASTAEDCAQLCTELAESCDLFNFMGTGAGQVLASKPAANARPRPLKKRHRPCMPRLLITGLLSAVCRLETAPCCLWDAPWPQRWPHPQRAWHRRR